MNTTSGNDELNALGYESSAPDFVNAPAAEVSQEDVAEVTTIVSVKRLLQNRQAYYQSINSIDLKPETLKVFSAEQQIAINKKVNFHLQELQSLVDSTITKVKESLNHGN